ncbi:MAG: hypothetical protein AB4042_18125, partial [Leptolyngbyaceae cyanobacterium]
QPLEFSDEAIASQHRGAVHPTRLNGWLMVGPLQSLAGARSRDDVIVQLEGSVSVSALDQLGTGGLIPERQTPALQIEQMPTQIGGHWYGLVMILGPVSPPSGAGSSSRYFEVQHFNPQTQNFDGPVEVVRIPESISDRNGIPRTSLDGIERSPLNADGWYIYGNFVADHATADPVAVRNGTPRRPDQFVVQALEPRAMVRLQPTRILTSKTAGKTYLYTENFNPAMAQQNTAATVWVRPTETSPPVSANSSGQSSNGAIAPPDMMAVLEQDWQEGDRALVIHLFGGIGGDQGESTILGVTPGHFSFGTAEVIRDPLSQDLRFQIVHHQVYAHNVDGIVSGSVQWAEYMGNIQRGWQGTRPVSDVVIQFPPVTQDYDFNGIILSPFETFVQQLTITMARYRVGDGTGSAILSPITSCVQDSNQALYATIRRVEQQVEASPAIQQWLADHPNHPQTLRFQQLVALGRSLERQLVPLGIIRRDWQQRLDEVTAALNQARNTENVDQMYSLPELSGVPSHHRLWSKQRQLLMALSSWRTVLPRRSHDELTSILLDQGAQLWFIRTNQIGGENPAIAPRVPNTLLGS